MPDLVVDGLDGSRIDRGYLADVASVARSVVLHVTVNNLRRITPDPTLNDAVFDLENILERIAELHNVCRLMDSKREWDEVPNAKVGILLGYQNAGFIDGDLALLPILHRLGVRILQITHNGPGPYGGGCSVDTDAGITRLGREFVRAANDAGILIDCSHSSDQLTVDVCALSTRPVLVTHANPSQVNPHKRNRSDEAIAAVTATGGVVGVCFLPKLIAYNGAVSLTGVIEHIRHLESVAGTDAIAFGSDFTTNQDHSGDRYAALSGDGVNVMNNDPYPIPGLAQIDVLFQEMAKSGYADAAIAKFAGQNFARVMRENESN